MYEIVCLMQNDNYHLYTLNKLVERCYPCGGMETDLPIMKFAMHTGYDLTKTALSLIYIITATEIPCQNGN